ncbi:MAG: ATP-binding cassette domain-containing protein [Rickettsiaceae bacterium]|nr:ATP-binding cassette domain-containing protein [Rickettsiaceae bacterium]
MIHNPIEIINLSYIANNKICFEDFNTHIDYGSRIGIIGRNGSGKSSLLKILQGILSPTYGNIQIPENTTLSYVPQTIENFTSFSGAERFNKSLTKALSNDPNILLLDEPTNHLDYNNRKSLLRKLDSYPGTLIIVSHDVELLNNIIDILWHIDQSQIHIFKGNYSNYLNEIKLKYLNIESQISHLQRDKKNMHQKLMQEQKRASKSKAKGQKSIT